MSGSDSDESISITSPFTNRGRFAIELDCLVKVSDSFRFNGFDSVGDVRVFDAIDVLSVFSFSAVFVSFLLGVRLSGPGNCFRTIDSKAHLEIAK